MSWWSCEFFNEFSVAEMKPKILFVCKETLKDVSCGVLPAE